MAAVFVIILAEGCSTAKNTAATRWWQAFNSRYNAYYNGAVAYVDGSLEKENGNQDNYTELLPLYTVRNKNSKELGKANFDRAILKAEKVIDRHSIKQRPQWKSNKRKTDRDKEWLSRKEYNPFMWKAWMLMGRSQFHEGSFDNAISTFAYMSMLYRTQPAIYSRAQAWLAKSYIEDDLVYDAEDIIRNSRRDSIPWQATKDWDYTLADYYLLTNDYKSAIPYLKKVIKHEQRRKQKAREWFIMGQVCQAAGMNSEAYKAYTKVIGLNPPYQLEFNARIARTEVMAATKSDGMIAKLRRMARSDKNKEYLDQVYFAIGNIHLLKKDTLKAIAAYEKGNEKATRSGVERAALLIKLADIYWEREKYSDARRCYNLALGMTDKENEAYERLSSRSKVLDELVPHTDAIHLQDSLQSLAQMDEKQRNMAIDRVIEALKKKEAEEKKKQAENEAANRQQNNGNGLADMKNNGNRKNAGQQTANNMNAGQQTGDWYFYNPTTVAKGKQQFQALWGKRDNVDNWQRINKTVVKQEENDLADMSDEQRDSILNVQEASDSVKNVQNDAANDPHKREYYLAQIPFTQEQVKASNDIIADGLYNSGVIFKDKLDNLPLSEKALTRLITQYSYYEHKDNAFYHLFLLYSRKGQHAKAESFVDSLKAEYPKSEWTALLSDPDYVVNARYGVHIEDSIYAATYEAFKADNYQVVNANVSLSDSRFPQGANRDKFMFIGALSKLNEGDEEACKKGLDSLVAKFPESEVAKIAGMIINGVKSGRRLRGAKFDIGNVWAMRSETLSDNEQLKEKPLSPERNTQFVFLLVYQPDSVEENKLLYQVAKYNFTSFLVRDFDIAIDNDDYLHRMRISGFQSYDEALQYSRGLLSQPQVLKLMGKARPFIVSVENLPLLGVAYSYDDYKKFYDINFAPIKPSTLQLLIEPENDLTEPEDETSEPGQGEVKEEETVGQYAGTNGQTGGTNGQQGGGVIMMQEDDQQTLKAQPVNRQGTTIQLEKEVQPASNVQPARSAQPASNVQPARSAQPARNVPAVPEKKATTPQKSQPKQEKKPQQVEKKKTFDIESEDYELEGF